MNLLHMSIDIALSIESPSTSLKSANLTSFNQSMSLTVNFQIFLISELFVTVFAVKSLSSVDPIVLDQSPIFPKSLRTQGTLVGKFPSMFVVVMSQFRLGPKSSSTSITNKLWSSKMTSPMFIHRNRTLKLLGANFARKILLISVNGRLVRISTSTICKSFEADFALVRPFARVDSHVVFEPFSIDEALGTDVAVADDDSEMDQSNVSTELSGGVERLGAMRTNVLWNIFRSRVSSSLMVVQRANLSIGFVTF